MLLGDARIWYESGFDIEKTKHRIHHGERILDETTANRRGARMEAFGRGQIRESEERPLISPDYTGLRSDSDKFIEQTAQSLWGLTDHASLLADNAKAL